MRGTQFAITFDIPLLQQIRQSLIAILHLFILSNPFENFPILFVRRITNLDLVAQAPQEGFIHKVFWREISREHDQNIERDFYFPSIMEREEIYAVFEGNDPAVKQVTRP